MNKALLNLSNSAPSAPQTPGSPERTSRRGKRKPSNDDESIYSKSPKKSRSTAWREEKGIKIQEEEKKLESLLAENGELVEKITCLFGALAQKWGKFEHMATFKKEYLEYHFPDFFYLDNKNKDKSEKLHDSQNKKENRNRKAKYLEKLMDNTKSHEKIVAMRRRVSEKLSFDINNNLK